MSPWKQHVVLQVNVHVHCGLEVRQPLVGRAVSRIPSRVPDNRW